MENSIFNAPTSRVSGKGQITVPKSVREKLNLDEGDRVVFVEEGGSMVLKKASLVAFDNFSKVIQQDMKENGITEEEVLEELEKIRQERWDERNRK